MTLEGRAKSAEKVPTNFNKHFWAGSKNVTHEALHIGSSCFKKKTIRCVYMSRFARIFG